MAIEPDRSRAIQLALVDALAAEYRLRRQARGEQAEAERWEQRAEFAHARSLQDLAEGARRRAARHQQDAATLLVQADELQAEVRLLRGLTGPRRWDGRAPPDHVDLEARFSNFEIDLELARIRATLASGVADAPTTGRPPYNSEDEAIYPYDTDQDNRATTTPRTSEGS